MRINELVLALLPCLFCLSVATAQDELSPKGVVELAAYDQPVYDPPTSGADAYAPSAYNEMDAPLSVGSEVQGAYPSNHHSMGCAHCRSPLCQSIENWPCILFGGIDALVVRPHFSEAVAYGYGRQTASTFDIAKQPIEFDPEGSVRVYLGMKLGRPTDSLRFTYTNLQGEIGVGRSVAADEFAIDPYGNIAGSVTVVDPSDVRLGSTLVGGDRIQTQTKVDVNLYDILFSREWSGGPAWDLDLDFGVRIADIDQTYESTISTAGTLDSQAREHADFSGAGLYFGMRGQKYFGAKRAFSFSLAANGALILGDYQVLTTNNDGNMLTINRTIDQWRTIPVFGTEVGGTWHVNDTIHLNVGWLLSYWNDLGSSGGTFGGFLNGADDANSLSFDGLVIRLECRI